LSPASEVDELRRVVDDVDERIARDLRTRVWLARRIARLKARASMPAFDFDRERAVIERYVAVLGSDDNTSRILAEDFARDVLKATRMASVLDPAPQPSADGDPAAEVHPSPEALDVPEPGGSQ
jgi:chorismate mutase